MEGNAPYHLVSAGDTTIPQVIACFSRLLWRLDASVVLHFLSGRLQPYTAAAIDQLHATHHESNSSTILIVVTFPNGLLACLHLARENGPAGRNVRILENISNLISY